MHSYRQASRYPLIIDVGWIRYFTKSSAHFNNSAAIITYNKTVYTLLLQKLLLFSTTEVVPSPTSWSCRSASSTNTLAAGCSTSSSFKMVAPSLVIVTSYNQKLQLTNYESHVKTTHPDIINKHFIQSNWS